MAWRAFLNCPSLPSFVTYFVGKIVFVFVHTYIQCHQNKYQNLLHVGRIRYFLSWQPLCPMLSPPAPPLDCTQTLVSILILYCTTDSYISLFPLGKPPVNLYQDKYDKKRWGVAPNRGFLLPCALSGGSRVRCQAIHHPPTPDILQMGWNPSASDGSQSDDAVSPYLASEPPPRHFSRLAEDDLSDASGSFRTGRPIYWASHVWEVVWEDEAEAADWDFRDGVQGKWSAPFFNVGPALSLCIGKGSSGYDSLQVFMIQSRAGSRIGGDGSLEWRLWDRRTATPSLETHLSY